MDENEVKAEKKRQKSEAKLAKRVAKVDLADTTAQPQATASPSQIQQGDESSVGVRFAEIVRGIIYVILAVSLGVALVLGEGEVIITLEDIINNLLVVTFGKIILVIIALALFIYGLKHMRLVK